MTGRRLSVVASVVAVSVLGFWGLPAVSGAGTSPASSDAMSVAATADRVAGGDRYQTAVEVALQVGGGSLTGLTRIIVVTGEAFPDGLTASGLAGYFDNGGRTGRTAILLTRTADLPEVTAQAIRASGVPANRVFVVGGTSAVSDAVYAAIARAAGWTGQGANPVTRISGADRYGTAAAIVEYVTQLAGGSLPSSYRTVLVANGEAFPDALAGGTLAYRNGRLIVLSRPPAAPTSSLDAIRGVRADCAVLLGGVAALSPGVGSQVGSALSAGGCGVTRIGGATRYETAALIANGFVQSNGPAQSVLLVSGETFPDALASAPLAGGNRPILLTTPNRLSPATNAWLLANGNSVTQLLVIGGSNAVEPSTAAAAANAANPSSSTTTTMPGSTTVPDPGPDPGPAPGPGPTTTTTTPGPAPTCASVPVNSAIPSVNWNLTSPPPGPPRSALVNAGGWTTIAGCTNTFSYRWQYTQVATPTDADWTDYAGRTTNFVPYAAFSILPAPLSVCPLTSARALVTATNAFGSTTVAATPVENISADCPLWPVRAGGAGDDAGYAIAALPESAGAFVTGEFDGEATFGATVLDSGADSGAFVAKVDDSGDWVWTLGTTGDDAEANGVVTLADGSAIVVGNFFDRITFAAADTVSGSAIVFDEGDNVLGHEIFVAKVTPGGKWAWAVKAGGTGNDFGEGITALPDGSGVVITGSDSGKVYVARVASADGAIAWERTVASADASGRSVSILPDGAGAIVVGEYDPSIDFGGSIGELTGTNGAVFVARIDSAGNWQWASKVDGPEYDSGSGVSVDPTDGSAIVTGGFAGTANFTPAASGSISLTAAGEAPDSNIFVGKVNASGEWVWAVRAGGDTNNDLGLSVKTLSDGSSIVSGVFRSSTAAFGATNLTKVGSRDLFVAKIAANGLWLWASGAGGTSANARGNGVTVLADGKILVTGYFDKTVAFGTSSLTSTDNSEDVFVARLNETGTFG